jgi:CBS domain-containing protein
LGVIYLIARTSGKAIGARLGAQISGAAKSVQKYLPLCLLSQAGVAIGLSILASHYFPGEIGNAIIVIITATAFILEIIGPSLVKVAVTKAGEVGLNVTEEDLVLTLKAEDIMDKAPPLIYENMSLAQILAIFSESPNLYYPVVDSNKKLLGIITVDNIKNTFMVAGLNDLLLAVDVMESPIALAASESSIFELKRTLARYNLEYLPVVDGDNKIVGFIERRMLYKIISTKVIELQRKADSLEATI